MHPRMQRSQLLLRPLVPPQPPPRQQHLQPLLRQPPLAQQLWKAPALKALAQSVPS
jgi:hypothetical protein